jgi:photosystem II stability/assembly factor-like uncharacterized protein
MQTKRVVLLGVIALVVILATTILHAGGQWNILQQMDEEDIRDYNGIAFISAKEGWVAGVSALDMESPGYIGHTRDGGATWEKAEVPINQMLNDIYFFDKKNGWAVGQEGMIVGTTNGGRRWDVQTSKVGNWLKGVHFVSPKIGYAVGMSETVVKTDNGGRQWNVLHGGEIASAVGDEETIVFNTVQFIDESTGWIAGVRISPETGGQDGLVQKTTDGGQTWMDQPTNIPDILEDIFFVDANNGWAVGENGIVLHTTNGGNSWDIQTSGTEEKLLSVSFADSAVGWTAGGGLGVSVILHTADGGSTWEAQTIDDPIISKVPANGIFVLDANNVWVTGNNGFVVSSSK